MTFASIPEVAAGVEFEKRLGGSAVYRDPIGGRRRDHPLELSASAPCKKVGSQRS
jgi:hypothetical protein